MCRDFLPDMRELMLGDLTHSNCPVIGYLNPGWSLAQDFVSISVFALVCSSNYLMFILYSVLMQPLPARSARVRGVPYDIA